MSSVESQHFDWDELSDLFGDGKTASEKDSKMPHKRNTSADMRT